MAAKYSDINRGPALNDAYNKLESWRKLDPAAKRNAYNGVKKPPAERVITERVLAWIQPFGATKDGIYYETRVPAANQTAEGGVGGAGQAVATLLLALIAGRFSATAPAGATDVIIEIPKFQFAQVRAAQRTGTANPNAVSRITGRPYTRWRSDSMSANFGKSATQNDFYESVKAIKALSQYTTFANAKGNTIGFRPEQSS